MATQLPGYSTLKKLSGHKHFSIYRAIRASDNKDIILQVGDNTVLQHELQLFKHINSNLFLKPQKLVKIDHTAILEFEDIPGVTLQSYLNDNAFGVEEFLNATLQIVDIVGILHKNHIIHKDINPQNFIFDPQTRKITLINLSVATKLSEEAQEYINVTQLEGTLAYTSPEQTGRMNRPVDYRTDFFSLGVLFFQMLSGQLPYETKDTLELVYYQIAKPAPNLHKIDSNIPITIAAIVDKLLAKMPEDRYASITGLKSDLNKCLEQWRNNQKIQEFKLGEKDVHDHLQISHQLYGREEEVKQLLNAFKKVNNGAVEMILIAGYSGIGKTSLVREVHKPIAGQHGYFIQGKFDQLQRSIPFSAFVTAFKSLVQQVLSEPNIVLTRLKEDLKNALGDLGQVVIDVIPEVELIMGPQPKVPQLNPTEAVHRFNRVFQKFVHVFAQAEHPLIIFLDDLQWVDSASLRLIENLLLDPESHHMLIIGAYRDNEVDSMHPLIISTQQLLKSKVNINTTTLQPLLTEDVEHLISDSLTLPIPQIMPLEKLIYEKTQGNPFFINEFLRMLYQKNLLSFSYEMGQWQWDINKIQTQEMMDNVIDLLTMKIHQLPLPTQEILKLAAVIGHQFSLQILSIVSEQKLIQVARQLWPAIENNLVIPLEEAAKTLALVETEDELLNYIEEKINYRFAHDRIQQANYQLIPQDVREEYHLKIARLLLKQYPLKKNSEYLFEIMDHFNQTIFIITDPKEKLLLAEYDLWAGEKAKAATAFQAARTYYQAGLDFIQPIDWKQNYKIAFNLKKELATTMYLTGEFDEAQKFFVELYEQASNTLDKVEVYRLNIQMLSTLNKHREAILLGRKALMLLGIKLPKHANTLQILRAIMRIKNQLRWKSPAKVKLLPMKTPENRAAADLITQLLNNAFISDQKLFILLASIDVSYSLRYGYTDSTSMACLVFAFTLMHALNLFKEGFAFVDLYSHLKQTYGEGIFVGKNHLVLGTFIDPWRFPAEKSLEMLIKGQQVAYDVGDIVYSNYCNVLATIMAYLIGRPLPEIQGYIKNTLAFMDKAKISDFRNNAKFDRYVAECLTNKIPLSIKKIAKFEKDVLQYGNKTEISFFYSMYAKLCYLFDYFKEAQLAAIKHKKYAEFALGILSNFEAKFYYAMAALANYKKMPWKRRAGIMRQINKIHSYVKQCATRYPGNFEFYLNILEAKLARINKQPFQAIELYQKAIKNASKAKVTHVIAIANEGLGRLFVELNLPQFSDLYFLNSYNEYKKWGALAKCVQLEKLYPNILAINQKPTVSADEIEQKTTAEIPQTVDMLAIIKATQTISGEIQLENLLKKLLVIVLEVSGAERAAILIKNKFDQWVIQAEGNLQKQRINHFQFEDPTPSLINFPLSLVNYVQRTEKTLIVTEDSHSDITRQDDYIKKNKPQSMLFMPLLYQGKLRRQLYLENRHSSDVFTPQQLQSLQLLSSQAVISLENAYLYHQATHDPLTQLANRSMLYQMFQYYSAFVLRENKKIALLFLDFDYFKIINDALGHELGDKLLNYLGGEFKKCVREGDIVSRLGGDEFVIMLIGIEDSQEVTRVADDIYTKLSNPIHLDGHEFVITTSMGISIFPDDGKDIQTLLKHADTAMYTAKDAGRNQYRFYSIELEAQHQATHMLTIELQRASERNEFRMFYQPIFSTKDNKLIGLEALLRWQHPKRGLLTADKFIASMEKSLLIESVGEWIIKTVMKQIQAWQKQQLLNVPVAINLSGVQFKNREISLFVKDQMQEYDLDPNFLEFELTETILIEHNEKVFQESDAMRKLGLRFILDDFGTGYSNLTYLKQLPISKLKIDRSFLLDYENPQSATIIEAIVAMAHQLDLQVIAEGVETLDHLNFIRRFPIDAVQGYYLSMPLSTEDCTEFLKTKK